MKTLHRSFVVSLFLPAFVSLASCSSDGESADPDAAAESSSASSQQDPLADLLEGIPLQARAPLGSGGPRTSSYWVIWSTCGEGSRAETAAANGGRAAGFILLDDLLQDPGITLGDRPMHTCEDGVAVLQGSTTDPRAALARQLLAAKLNVLAGSERCEASEDLMATGDALLASFGGADGGRPADSLEVAVVESLFRVATLLTFFNSGELCR